MEIGGHIPCHEYIICSFAGSTLGFEIIQLDAPQNQALTKDYPLLGNVMVTKVNSGGDADKGGVRAFDAIVTVNGEYVAFMNSQTTLSRLRNPERPLLIGFARALPSQWSRIGKSLDEPVKSGD